MEELGHALAAKLVVPVAVMGMLREGKSTLLNHFQQSLQPCGGDARAAGNKSESAFVTSAKPQSCTRGVHALAVSGDTLGIPAVRGKTLLLLDFEGLGELAIRRPASVAGLFDTRLFALGVRAARRIVRAASHSS